MMESDRLFVIVLRCVRAGMTYDEIMALARGGSVS